MSATNPDQRPLPTGWITQYDDSYKAWFYIDTKANPPTPSWTHPLGPPSANPSHSESHSPHKQTSYSSVSSGLTGTYSGAPKDSKNPDTRPLPAGWITEYDESYKTWFYVDTKANPPAPSWVHPLGPPTKPVSAAAPPKASSPPTVNPGEPENPDKRPLPKGWMQQYDTSHKAFFYVDTTVLHPTPSWTHPLGPASPTTSLSPASRAHAVSPLSSQSAVPGEPENPDKRPLPTGWIGQYDASHKAFFYVNTAAPNPSPTWTHPLGPPSTTSSAPHTTSGPTSPVAYSALSPPPPVTTPGQPENPDKRPLPTGWVQQYDTSHKAWFYVDVSAPNPSPSWTHPLGPPATSPVPGAHSSSTALLPPNSGQPTNPDTRPLPYGWVDEYDTNHKAWFYVDTKAHNPTPSWTHPLGPPPTSPVPPTTTTPGGPQNPDTRALPPGWISEYDTTRHAWFYVDTTKNPPASAWTHPLGPPPPGGHNATPSSSGYGSPAPGPTSPYGAPASYNQPTYGGGPQQQKPGKDQLGQIGGLLGGLLGGKTGGKAGKYLGSASGLLGGKQGHSQQPYGSPSYGGAPPGGSYRPPGQY